MLGPSTTYRRHRLRIWPKQTSSAISKTENDRYLARDTAAGALGTPCRSAPPVTNSAMVVADDMDGLLAGYGVDG